MLPAGSCRNTVSPSLFHTAEPALHQKRSAGLSMPQPVNSVTAALGSTTRSVNV